MTVAPVKLKQHDATIQADRLRVIGYRGSCPSCPWIGRVRRTVALARADVAEHDCQDDAA